MKIKHIIVVLSVLSLSLGFAGCANSLEEQTARGLEKSLFNLPAEVTSVYFPHASGENINFLSQQEDYYIPYTMSLDGEYESYPRLQNEGMMLDCKFFGENILYLCCLDEAKDAAGSISLCCASLAGELLYKETIEDHLLPGFSVFCDIEYIEDDVILVFSSGNESQFILLTQELKLKQSFVVPGQISELAVVSSEVYVHVKSNNSQLLRLDMEQRCLSDTIFENAVFELYGVGLNNCLLVTDGEALISIDPENRRHFEIIRWADGGIHKPIELFQLDKGYLIYSMDVLTAKPYLGIIEPVDNLQSQVITLASVGKINGWCAAAAESYNMTHSEYQVQIIEYEDKADLDLAIISGKGPDLVQLKSMDREKYQRKELLWDLYELMKSDSDFLPDDLLPEYRNAFEIDGKLYSITTGFALLGLAADPEILIHGWDLEQFMNAASERPLEMAILPDGSSSSFLQLALEYNLECFIDPETIECCFDGDDFLKLLEFSKEQFPVEYSTFCSYDLESIANGSTMVERLYIGTVSAFASVYEQYGNSISIGPFPGVNGLTLEDTTDYYYGICSSSDHPQEAWNVLKLLLSDSAQACIGSKFPVTVSAFENMTKSLSEENAAYVPQLKELMGKTVQTGWKSLDAINIVLEEADYYFSGAKTAEETADIIQNRVQTYLSEQQ